MDLVMLSLDHDQRAKLLSDRFAIGSDASATWGNGKSAHDDPNARILFYGVTKGAFAGFGLDGATLKPDESGTEALYGKNLANFAVVDAGMSPPDASGPFVAQRMRPVDDSAGFCKREVMALNWPRDGLCGNIWTSSGTLACLFSKPCGARWSLPLNGK
jgi:hypothetical protein